MKRIRVFTYLLIALGISACTGVPSDTNTASAGGGIVTHAAYVCELSPEIVSGGGGQPTSIPDVTKLSPFVLTHMSRDNEPYRFGYSAAAGSSVGIGTLQPDGRWVVGNWIPRDTSGPFFTLMTFFPNKQILLSHRSGGTSRVTFAGQCIDKTSELQGT